MHECPHANTYLLCTYRHGQYICVRVFQELQNKINIFVSWLASAVSFTVFHFARFIVHSCKLLCSCFLVSAITEGRPSYQWLIPNMYKASLVCSITHVYWSCKRGKSEQEEKCSPSISLKPCCRAANSDSANETNKRRPKAFWPKLDLKLSCPKATSCSGVSTRHTLTFPPLFFCGDLTLWSASI